MKVQPRRDLGRIALILLTLSLFAGCANQQEPPAASQSASASPSLPSTSSPSEVVKDAFIPGLTMKTAVVPFRRIRMDCGPPSQEAGFTYLPPYLLINCFPRAESEDVAPFAAVVGEDNGSVHEVSVSLKDPAALATALPRRQVLFYLETVAELAYEGSQPARVKAWLDREVPVDGKADLDVGGMHFTLSGAAYEQELSVTHPSSCFRFANFPGDASDEQLDACRTSG